MADCHHLYPYAQQYNNYIFDFFRTYTKSETLLKVAYTLLDVLSPSCADGTQSSKNANNNSSNVADISVMNCHLLNCCHLEYINFRGNKVQRCVQAVNSEFWVDDMDFGKSFETVMDIVISQQQKKIILNDSGGLGGRSPPSKGTCFYLFICIFMYF